MFHIIYNNIQNWHKNCRCCIFQNDTTVNPKWTGKFSSTNLLRKLAILIEDFSNSGELPRLERSRIY